MKFQHYVVTTAPYGARYGFESERAARAAARKMAAYMDAAAVEHEGTYSSVEEYVTSRRSGDLLPDDGGVPARVHRALCRRYGRPSTIGGGETAYWRIA